MINTSTKLQPLWGKQELNRNRLMIFRNQIHIMWTQHSVGRENSNDVDSVINHYRDVTSMGSVAQSMDSFINWCNFFSSDMDPELSLDTRSHIPPGWQENFAWIFQKYQQSRLMIKLKIICHSRQKIGGRFAEGFMVDSNEFLIVFFML